MRRLLPPLLALAAWLAPVGEAKAEEAPVQEAPAVALPARIDVIRVEGLVRTKPFVVRRELYFKEGDVVTQEALDLAVARLWNTTIFAHVDVVVVNEGGRNVIVIRLEDRWTLNPLFSFGSGGNTFFFRAGAADNNVAGRFLDAALQYEYFDGFHGGQVSFRNPRLAGERMELLVQLDRLVRPRQGFSDQRTQAIVEIAKLANRDRFRFALRGRVFADRFLPPLDPPPFFPAPTETLVAEPSFRLGRVDVVRIRQRGASLELRPGVGTTNSDVADWFASVTGEALAFAMVGARWNFAVRVRGSGISKVPPHLQLWAGGLDLIRGFPDNFVRTQSMALANLEARFTAFDSTWIALVPTVFVDAIAARSPAGTPGTALSMGAGLRALVPKFVGTGLRADLAVPIHANLRPVTAGEQPQLGPVTPTPDLGSVQLSIGVYQFF